MSHNSDGLFSDLLPGAGGGLSILPALPGQQDFTAKLLSGSQAKTAFALRLNAERLIREGGLNCTGFLTLTVGDYFCHTHGKQIPQFKNHCPVCKKRNLFSEMQFCGIYDAGEASRRINNVRKFLLTIFSRAILVTERHKNRKIHFHLIGTLASGFDIRSGLNFDEVRRRRYGSASDQLRGLWATLRDVLPRYGFGRHELMPVRKTGECVAAYISKYIEKNVCNRTADDKRKKLVRYIGWEKAHLKPNEFEWDTLRARAWRAKSKQIFNLAGCELREKNFNPPERIIQDCVSAAGKIRPKMLDGAEVKKKFGARWAMVGSGIWSEVFGDDKLPWLEITPQRLLDTQKLLGMAQRRHESIIIGNFRWLKEMLWEQLIKSIDEETARYEFWALENGGLIEIPEDYFTGNFAQN